MIVRRIIEHSVVDGPGNRTAIFLQGCNIRCAYCHNPETQSMTDEAATEMTVEDVVEEVEKGIPFIRGITVSGGECMLQAEELAKLFAKCKQLGLNCLIDSNGTIDFSLYPELMNLTDGVMLDVKAWDEDVFRKLTGATNTIVKRNLKYLAEQNKIEEIRIVCHEETDVENDIRNIAAVLSDKTKETNLKLIRFRNHGVVGRMATSASPSDRQMLQWKELAEECGFIKTVTT